MQLALVGQVLGHSDPKTTHRYVNATRQVISQAGNILDDWQRQHQSIVEAQEVVH